MPYISQQRREVLADRLVGHRIKGAGELNFVLTGIVNQYIHDHGGLSYSAINEVVGVLECAKLEAYRRVAVPYEDDKCAENGDVY